MTGIAIVIGPAAPPLVQRAATDLQSYLARLFGARADIVPDVPKRIAARIVLGLCGQPHVRGACTRLPRLSPQGHAVVKTAPDTMVLAGGSPPAAAWAAYELAERYGVRYLLHRDVLPDQRRPFFLPDADQVYEPVQKIRSWRVFNAHLFGPEVWRLEQHRQFMDQLFKLKFNGVYLAFWPQHPFVDYTIAGIRKTSWGLLWADTPIPIGSDNIGREHLWPGMTQLTHPDFVGVRTIDEALPIGRRLMTGVIEHAKALGMRTSIAFQPFSFPAELAPVLGSPAPPGVQGPISITSETGDLNNPKHRTAVETVFGAYLNEWGTVDEFLIGLPEHPYADRTFPEAWRKLAAKHGLEPALDPNDLLARTRRNALTAGGTARGQREVKSAITMMQFLDEFFSGNDLLNRLRAKNIALTVGLNNSSEELLPFIHRILPPGTGILTGIDYTSSRALRRLRLLERVDTTRTPAALVVTLQDDNIGWVPQVATDSLHLLLQALARNGWQGFFTRFWPIGDLDPPAAYLARASWNSGVTPRDAYLDHFSRVYGAESAELLCQVMRLLADATLILDLDFLSLLFPVPSTMWVRQANRPMAEGLFHVMAQYRSARLLLERVARTPGPAARERDLAYWMSRLDFAVHALDEIRLLHEGRMALEGAREARRAGNRDEAGQHLDGARKAYASAAAAGEEALRAAASSVRDDSDRGAIAGYYHFMVREVKEKAREVISEEDRS